MECPRRIPTLDGLRGLAALVVVVFHFPRVGESHLAGLIHHAKESSLSGSLAVDILYVLSGFLITRIILREIAGGKFSARNFLIKRALRIFPIFVLIMAFLACLEPISQQWLAAACYVSNYTIPFDKEPHVLSHSWSLSLMEQFYTLWAMLFLFLPLASVRRIAWPWGPLLAVTAAAGVLMTVDSQLAWGIVHRGLPFRMLSLLLGASLAFHEVTIRRWPTRLVVAAVVACYLLMLGTRVGIKYTDWSGFRWLGVISRSSTSLFVVHFAIMANERTGFFRKMLTLAPLKVACQISYGLYLYHYLVLFLMFNPGGIEPMRLTVSYSQALVLLVMCLGIPWLSYVLIERPCLQLKSRLTARPAAVGPAAGPVVQTGGAGAVRTFYPTVLPRLLRSLRSAGRSAVAFAQVPLPGERASRLRFHAETPQAESDEVGDVVTTSAESFQPAEDPEGAPDPTSFEPERKAA